MSPSPPSSPPASPFGTAPSPTNTTFATPFPSPGRARSRTFSQAEADEKLEREEESQRAREGGGEGQEGAISAGELRAEVSARGFGGLLFGWGGLCRCSRSTGITVCGTQRWRVAGGTRERRAATPPEATSRRELVRPLGV